MDSLGTCSSSPPFPVCFLDTIQGKHSFALPSFPSLLPRSLRAPLPQSHLVGSRQHGTRPHSRPLLVERREGVDQLRDQCRSAFWRYRYIFACLVVLGTSADTYSYLRKVEVLLWTSESGASRWALPSQLTQLSSLQCRSQESSSCWRCLFRCWSIAHLHRLWLVSFASETQRGVC
jgi:hypothetical protein